MIKKAMLDVSGALAEADTGARLLLQVHDELLFEVPSGEEDDLAELVVSRDGGCDGAPRSAGGRGRCGKELVRDETLSFPPFPNTTGPFGHPPAPP